MRIDAARIKSWVERIERLLEERAAINGDIKDIYSEIKSGDHDAKAIRKLIQRRAQDEANRLPCVSINLVRHATDIGVQDEQARANCRQGVACDHS